MERCALTDGLPETTARLRAQLAQMTAASQLLEGSAADSKGRACLTAMNQSICRMLRLVGRLELACRLTDEDEIRLIPRPVDLGQWLRGLGERMDGVLAGAGVEFSCTAPEGLVGNVDEKLLEQMLLELVSNAAKAGGKVSLTLTQGGDKACFSVTDQGHGLSPQELGALFDRARQGMGVAIAQQIAELHGGAIMADSAPGKGLCMVAVIPLRMNLPSGRLESPRVDWDQGGFDPVLVGLSEVLPASAFDPEDLG